MNKNSGNWEPAMTAELFFSDATELAERIRTKDVSPVEIVQAHLDRTDSDKPTS